MDVMQAKRKTDILVSQDVLQVLLDHADIPHHHAVQLWVQGKCTYLPYSQPMQHLLYEARLNTCSSHSTLKWQKKL
jgi:hypothetical protein